LRQYLRYRVIRRADSLIDQLTPSEIANIETEAKSQEDLQEGILSQIKQIIFGSAVGEWNDPIPVSLKTLAESLFKAGNLKQELENGMAVDIPPGSALYISSDNKVSFASASSFAPAGAYRFYGVNEETIGAGLKGYVSFNGIIENARKNENELWLENDPIFLSKTDGEFTNNVTDFLLNDWIAKVGIAYKDSPAGMSGAFKIQIAVPIKKGY